MNEPRRPPVSPIVVTGVVLIALGVLFTMSSFDLIDAGSIGDYWPLVLIVPGFLSFARPRKSADRFWGAVLLGIGTLLLLRNLGIIWIRFRHVWPVVLVALGVYLIWKALDGRRPNDGQDRGPGTAALGGGVSSGGSSGGGIGSHIHDGVIAGLDAANSRGAGASAGGDRLDEFAVFGGGDRMVRSRSFRGGSVTAIMGGFDIDLRDAEIEGDSARIEVFVIMGGIDLKVPESWTVVIDVTPVMGGADYAPGSRRPPAETPPKVLTLTGFVLMGGVEVRH